MADELPFFPTSELELPVCPICQEDLGTHGGPASLPCGHNGCLDCLQESQNHNSTCPLCRTPFGSVTLGLNTELRDALGRASAVWADNHSLMYSQYEEPHLPVSNSTDKNAWVSVKHLEPDEEREWSQQPSPQVEISTWNVLKGLWALMMGPPEDGRQTKGSWGGHSGGDYQPSAPPLLEFHRRGVPQRSNMRDSWIQRSLESSNNGSSDIATVRAILEQEPPQWLPDSYSATCMQCGAEFRSLTRSRHHCRFCGGVFCFACTRQRRLLPIQFRQSEPQRVCDSCADCLAPAQRLLAGRISHAAQILLHDVTDPMSSMRGWLNNPLATSMQEEIFKATATVRNFAQVDLLKPEKGIPDWVLSKAAGLAIVTVFKFGIGMTYKVGTGLVIARQGDGTWSSPSAIGLAGMGYGLQIGCELIDVILVLCNADAIKAFCGRAHLSLGAGLSVSAGPLGRSAEADVRAGLTGAAACLSYSCSKGAFVGLSVEGAVVATRGEVNGNFYGDMCIDAKSLLLGGVVSKPRAAEPLYQALRELYRRVEVGAT